MCMMKKSLFKTQVFRLNMRLIAAVTPGSQLRRGAYSSQHGNPRGSVARPRPLVTERRCAARPGDTNLPGCHLCDGHRLRTHIEHVMAAHFSCYITRLKSAQRRKIRNLSNLVDEQTNYYYFFYKFKSTIFSFFFHIIQYE